ncbi:MAG: PilZ domain-containing protein [Lachnospiraceae bacterium]|nr:PilZ domain-containing protein [Candidatus Colinaster scatohippi]
MLISGLSAGTGVQIVVGIGLQTMEFNSNIAEVHDNCIYVEPILKDEKMLGFGTKGLVLTLIATDSEEGRAFQFSNVKIRNIKTQDGKLYHEVSCKTEGKAINRRGACRVWIGESGVASAGLGTPPFDVTVKDISISGIAFICDKDQDIPVGNVVHINFKDDSANTRFDVSAIIVRSEEMERSRIMYGCKLNQESAAISKYVNEKQREKLKAARQSKIQPLTNNKK